MKLYIDGWVQDCSNPVANTLELLQYCTKPSIWYMCNMLSKLAYKVILIFTWLMSTVIGGYPHKGPVIADSIFPLLLA